MQPELLSRIKGRRLGTVPALICLLLCFSAFCAAAFLLGPEGSTGTARSVSEARLMTGEDGVTDPLEYAELMPGLKININTASAHALGLLPEIGEKRAEAIIAYREETGGFGTIEEITNIYGIGDGIFERIKELITVGDS